MQPVVILDEGVGPPAPSRSSSRANQGRSTFGEWVVLRSVSLEGGRGPGPPLSSTEEITRALRGALLRHAIDPPPAALSGHTPDGRLLARPHAAFLALPSLGPSSHNASVTRVAIVLPHGIAPRDREAVLRAVARWQQRGMRLVLGRLGAMQLSCAAGSAAEEGLGPDTWLGPARRWASVTPVALHRNPGKLTSPDPAVAARAARRAEEIVSDACTHVGLPAPVRVRIMRRSRFPGVPAAPEFMPYPRKQAEGARFQRVCAHVELEFDEAVQGPVLLGAGRYFGLGLCQPPAGAFEDGDR